MEEERTPWWVWVPALPRPIIAAAWAVFWSLSAFSAYIRHLAVPGQAWWLDIWNGLGGNAIGIFSWAVIATQLTSEVVYMIFTFGANKKAVENAATKNREKGREEGIEIGRGEGRAEAGKEWLDWLDEVRDMPREDWPPPPNTGSEPYNGKREK